MGNVPEHVKRRWRGIKAYNKTRQRRAQKRRHKLVEILQNHTAGKLTQREIAAMLGVEERTIGRDMKWLRRELARRRLCLVCGQPAPHRIPERYRGGVHGVEMEVLPDD